MLSIAPAAPGYLLEMAPLHTSNFDEAPIVADLGVAGDEADDVQGWIVSSETRPLNLFIPPIAPEARPVFAHQPADNGALRGDWPDALPWELEPYPQLPPIASQDPSAPSTFIDIGNLDEMIPTGIFSDDAADQEARDVLEMLSSLKYLPNNLHAEATTLTGRGTPGVSAKQLRNDLHDEGTSQSGRPAADAEYEAPATVAARTVGGEQSNDDMPEGGMIALVRDVLIEESAAAEAAADADIESLLGVPVKMDSAYGKFQAFEVSAAEDAPSPSASPAAGGAKTTPPLNPAAQAAPIADVESMPEVRAQMDSAKLQAFEEWTAQEAPSPAGSLAVRDAKTRPALDAAAAMVFFAFAARAARPPGACKPDDHSAMTVPPARREV